MVAAEAWLALWLLMLLWVQVKDYTDGTWELWPEQVPVFSVTTVVFVVDVVVLRSGDAARPGLRQARNVGLVVAGAAQLIDGFVWFGLWVGQSDAQRARYGPHGDGTNDWGADSALRSRTLRHIAPRSAALRRAARFHASSGPGRPPPRAAAAAFVVGRPALHASRFRCVLVFVAVAMSKTFGNWLTLLFAALVAWSRGTTSEKEGAVDAEMVSASSPA